MSVTTRINDITNVAIILVVAVLAIQRLGFRNEAGNRGELKFYKAGDVVRSVPVGALRESKRTLLVQIRSTCPACQMAIPFYRHLLEQVRIQRVPLRVVAVTTQPAATCRTYLAENRIGVDDVFEVTPLDGLISITPALVLVDSRGVVVGAWLGGALSSSDRSQLEATIGLRM